MRARTIGGLRLIDDHEADDKIIAVMADDRIYGSIETLKDAPQSLIDRIRHYFLTYKDLPGQKRKIEIAMCLATKPRVLVLDERLAGMGAEESDRMLSLLEGLKADHAILLVEHDMDAVFRVSDEITVMVNGRVIATGKPADIRANADVQTAYLGDEGAH